MKIEPYLNFLTTLRVSNRSLCTIRTYLNWTKLLYKFLRQSWKDLHREVLLHTNKVWCQLEKYWPKFHNNSIYSPIFWLLVHSPWLLYSSVFSVHLLSLVALSSSIYFPLVHLLIPPPGSSWLLGVRECHELTESAPTTSNIIIYHHVCSWYG